MKKITSKKTYSMSLDNYSYYSLEEIKIRLEHLAKTPIEYKDIKISIECSSEQGYNDYHNEDGLMCNCHCSGKSECIASIEIDNLKELNELKVNLPSKLVGMTVKEAKKLVKNSNLKSKLISAKTANILLTIPPNVVQITHKNNKVIAADTQDSIDARCDE